MMVTERYDPLRGMRVVSVTCGFATVTWQDYISNGASLMTYLKACDENPENAKALVSKNGPPKTAVYHVSDLIEVPGWSNGE